MKFILSYMKKTWLFILITMVIKFIGTFLELLIPYVLEYIIDSVAWGYYKLKRCDEAKEWIDKITPEYLEQKEFKIHYNQINKCIKEAK